jgi:hypothetical protein
VIIIACSFQNLLSRLSPVQESSADKSLCGACNAALWTLHARKQLEEYWEGQREERTRLKWEHLWRSLPQFKDWYNEEAQFLQHLLPRLPAGAQCLELGTGRNSLAAKLHGAHRVQSILSVDITREVVVEQKRRHVASISHGARPFGFEVANSLKLKFSELSLLGWQRFDVVFEKAGLFDIHRKNTGLLQRLLACIVTEAFQPSRGGSIVLLITKEQDDKVGLCSDCDRAGLVGALASRPEFNCSIAERTPLPLSWMRKKSRREALLVKCGGVSERVAVAGCEAIWLRSE